VLSPSGLFAVTMLMVSGALLSRGFDARYLIATGLVVVATGNFWLSRLNLGISPWQAVWPRVVVIVGLSMCFAPINVAAFLFIPKEMRGAAVGLLALLRNEGGSVGTSIAQILHQRREQFHILRLNEGLDALNPAVAQWFERGQEFFTRQFGDGPRSHLMALQSLAHARDRQALSLAYFDVFTFLAVISLALVLLVPMMRRSVAEKGAHAGAE
jgi:DHA2 family multidrug resistance protein